jgi:hypothetical protein
MRPKLGALSRGRRLLLAASAAALAGASLGACAFLGGAAVGAAGTSTAYEVQNKKALEDLDEAFGEGRISREEYLRRKHEIEKRSAVY